MSMREKTQADFDLERVMDMFDRALISKDERVINALRQLLMITALTAPEAPDASIDQNNGPFRQLQQDINNLSRRVSMLENEKRSWMSNPGMYPGYGATPPIVPQIRTASGTGSSSGYASAIAGQAIDSKLTEEFTKQFNGGQFSKGLK